MPPEILSFPALWSRRGRGAGPHCGAKGEIVVEKIDFVLTWVDGQDPRWQAEKQRYMSAETGAAQGSANGECRYRDFGLLRYWFRAVECFAPWVNRIFFVTCGQKPEWLNEAHPKLRLVDHRDYIPSEYLPTFNSNTIELNLFRLDELSERFVLFNDDMFLLRPLRPEFFFKKGYPVLPCSLAFPTWLWYGHVSRFIINNSGLLKCNMDIESQVWKHWRKFFNIRALGFMRAMKNLLSISINRSVIFGTFGHLPLPHLKSTIAEIWERNPEIMDRAARHRFRNDECVSHWVACGWNMLNGKFQPDKLRGVSTCLDRGNVDAVCKTITGRTFPDICINDTDGCGDIFSLFSEVAKAFETLLPARSSFEKDSCEI